MRTDESEVVSLEHHLCDFEQEIKKLDESFFVARDHPPARVITFLEYPDGGIVGERVGTVASFVDKLPEAHKESSHIIQFPVLREGYVIWQKGTERKISFLKRHPDFCGSGDAVLMQFWLLAAISLVRARILHHTQWFPDAGLRSIASMTKHIKLFGDEGFCELRKLPDELSAELTVASRVELDMQLTQRLFVAAVTHGASYEDALSLLMTN